MESVQPFRLLTASKRRGASWTEPARSKTLPALLLQMLTVTRRPFVRKPSVASQKVGFASVRNSWPVVVPRARPALLQMQL